MKNGKMHGNGSLALFNGDKWVIFSYFFTNWKKQKKRRFILSLIWCLSVVGQFSRGSLHGRGRYSFAAGGWYEGEFQEKQWTRDSKTMRVNFS